MQIISSFLNFKTQEIITEKSVKLNFNLCQTSVIKGKSLDLNFRRKFQTKGTEEVVEKAHHQLFLQGPEHSLKKFENAKFQSSFQYEVHCEANFV